MMAAAVTMRFIVSPRGSNPRRPSGVAKQAAGRRRPPAQARGHAGLHPSIAGPLKNFHRPRVGFNVAGGGQIKLTGGAVRGNVSAHPTGLGFLTAGIRIADVVSTGRVDLRDYASTGNAVGVLVEDSLGPGIKLRALTITAGGRGPPAGGHA